MWLVFSLFYALLALVMCILSQTTHHDNLVAKYYEGKMIGFPDKGRQIYLVLNYTLFPLANPDTIDALGIWIGDCNYVASKYFEDIPRGHAINMYDPTVDMNNFYKWIRIARNLPRELKMPEPDLYIKDQIRSNMAMLKNYVEKARPGIDFSKRACTRNDGYVRFDAQTYGRYGNALIELKNGIFFAEITNRTYILHKNQIKDLGPFRLDYLKQKFCVISKGDYNQNHTGAYIETIHARDAYFGYGVWNDPVYSDFKLPHFDKSIFSLLESYSMEIFACLWSSVREEEIDATAIAMAEYLNNNTLYIAIHKRSYEGDCNNIMGNDASISLERPFPGNYSVLSDYSTYVKSNPKTTIKYPLCDMHGDFIERVCTEMFSTSSSSSSSKGCPFVALYAWDGEGEFNPNDMYHPSILSINVSSKAFKEIEELEGDWISGILEAKGFVVDMLLAMNSELFILSPHSSFSWNIVEMRDIMHKQSYPHFIRPPDQALLNIWTYGTVDKNDIQTEWNRFKQRFSVNNDMAFHDYKNTKEQENLKEQNNTNELNGTGYHISSTLLQPHDYYSPPSYVNISSSDLLGLHQMIKNYLFDNPSAIDDKVIYCLYALICYNVCLIIWCQYQWYGGRSCTSPCDISSKERWKQNQSYLPLQTFDNDGD